MLFCSDLRERDNLANKLRRSTNNSCIIQLIDFDVYCLVTVQCVTAFISFSALTVGTGVKEPKPLPRGVSWSISKG